jgi:predicted nucleic-acid-binding protein
MLALDTNVLARYYVREEDAAPTRAQQGIDFADALHHASSRACEAFLTFDARRFAAKARRMAITPPVRLPR